METHLPEVSEDGGLGRTRIKLVAIVSSCNFLEMYNFMAFGYYARWIARAFFPATSEFASLTLAFATFGTGFLMRPTGAIVLGAYMDRHGRRAGLLLALALMATGTLLISCSPGSQLGIPKRPSPEVAKRILDEVVQFSKPFGTKITIENGVGIIRIPQNERSSTQ